MDRVPVLGVEKVDAFTEYPRLCFLFDAQPQARMEATKALFELLPDLVTHNVTS
jgi:hypothetical protein